MSDRRVFHLPPYNSFSPEERRATTPLQNAAMREGRLVRPQRCSICRFGDPVHIEGRGYIFSHLEDYRDPLAVLPACKTCHAALHARFRDPERWLRIAERHTRPGAWFLALTLDPASQEAPFDRTYPVGLPPLDIACGDPVRSQDAVKAPTAITDAARAGKNGEGRAKP
jgi:hypothetical protein